MPTYLVLVNPGAGSVDEEVDAAQATSWRDDEDLVAIHDELAALGDVEVALVRGDADVSSAIDGAEQDTVLVVVGGDGTLHRFVNLLGDRPNPVLLIPGGTGNDFAGGVDLPEDLREATAIARTGVARSMDLMDVGGVVAVNAAHLGIGVDAAQAASGLKDRLGKLAYPAGAARAALEFQPLTVTITVDDEVVVAEEPVAMLGIFNGSRIGGGTPICPPADPSDGLLDLVVLTADTRPALAATTAAVMAGTHLERDDVVYRQGRTVDVQLHDEGPAAWNVDGELLDLPAVLRCTVRKSAWRLFTPR